MNTDIMTKSDFDNAFNHLFFSRDFIDKMVRRFGICPAGLTIDTRVEDGNKTFHCVTKRYGYENSVRYIPDAAWDDFIITNDEIDPEIVNFMREYVHVNNPKLYEDSLRGDKTPNIQGQEVK